MWEREREETPFAFALPCLLYLSLSRQLLLLLLLRYTLSSSILSSWVLLVWPPDDVPCVVSIAPYCSLQGELWVVSWFAASFEVMLARFYFVYRDRFRIIGLSKYVISTCCTTSKGRGLATMFRIRETNWICQ